MARNDQTPPKSNLLSMILKLKRLSVHCCAAITPQIPPPTMTTLGSAITALKTQRSGFNWCEDASSLTRSQSCGKVHAAAKLRVESYTSVSLPRRGPRNRRPGVTFRADDLEASTLMLHPDAHHVLKKFHADCKC